MSSSSKIYGVTGPNREHIVLGNGLGGEVGKLRSDGERATGSGVQYVHFAEFGDEPVTLTTSGISIIQNDSGYDMTVVLPNATDGCVKRVVNGINGVGGGGFMFVQSNNSFENDLTDLSYGWSIDYVYIEELGGWVVTNLCTDIGGAWD